MRSIEDLTPHEQDVELQHWQGQLSALQLDASNKIDQAQDAYLGNLQASLDAAAAAFERVRQGDLDAGHEVCSHLADIRTLFRRMERVTTSGGPSLA